MLTETLIKQANSNGGNRPAHVGGDECSSNRFGLPPVLRQGLCGINAAASSEAEAHAGRNSADHEETKTFLEQARVDGGEAQQNPSSDKTARRRPPFLSADQLCQHADRE